MLYLHFFPQRDHVACMALLSSIHMATYLASMLGRQCFLSPYWPDQKRETSGFFPPSFDMQYSTCEWGASARRGQQEWEGSNEKQVNVREKNCDKGQVREEVSCKNEEAVRRRPLWDEGHCGKGVDVRRTKYEKNQLWHSSTKVSFYFETQLAHPFERRYQLLRHNWKHFLLNFERGGYYCRGGDQRWDSIQ